MSECFAAMSPCSTQIVEPTCMKIMALKQLLIAIGIFGLMNASYAEDVYVSHDGRDDNLGTQEAPLATLEGARVRVASTKAEASKPIKVWVQGGTYHLSQPLRFEANDSGTQQFPIHYRAMPGEEVVLKGSLPLDPGAWKLWKNGIYQQSLKGTPLEGRQINQLFMSDERMVRARFPNWDFDNPLRTGKGYLHATNPKTMKMLSFDSDDLKERAARWKNPQAGIVHAFHSHNWGNFQFRIKELDLNKSTIHFSEGGWQAQRRSRGIGAKHGGSPGSPFYIENIFEELDTPFEWFHAVESDTLYFKPPTGMDLADVTVEAAVVSRIIEVEGAEHIHFDGFQLTQTRATFMDAYEDLARGDWAIHRGGAVYFKDSQNCSVQNFHIQQVGGNGIFLDGFNRDIHLSGCLIEQTGDSAVCFVGDSKAVREYQTWENAVKEISDLEPGPKTKDYPKDCSVKNTITRDVGIYGKQTSGVLISMAMDITVDHCSVYRIARAGVTINDGTWGGHKMSNCDIYDTILDTGEHGPFNAWGRERFWAGSKLTKDWVMLDAVKPVILRDNLVGNYRSGVSAGNWTIDLDDGSSNFEIYNNLMLGSTLKLRDGYFRKVTNNIMVSAVPLGWHCWPADNSDDVFERNITVVSGAIEGSGKTYRSMINPARMPAEYGLWGEMDSNLWWNTNAKDFSAGQVKSLTQWQEIQGKNDVFADPMFVDPANRNYQVKPASPALKLGFKNFPIDQFGHQMTRIMQGSREFEDRVQIQIRLDARGGDVRYTLDGTDPTAESLLYSAPLAINETTTIHATTFDQNGHAVGFPDVATLTKVEEVKQQSWLASVIAGVSVKSDGSAATTPDSLSVVKSEAETTYELPEVSGQFVRIELPGKNRVLSLAEVEVYSGGQNIALNQKASQSSTDHDGTAELAIDGNSDGEYRNGSVTHTDGDKDTWWELDLGQVATIEKIAISNRNSHQERLENFALSVLGVDRSMKFTKKDCQSASRIIFAQSETDKPASLDWQGLELVTISDHPDYIDASGGQDFGAFVVKIVADSNAAKAGIHNGDTIIKADSIEIRTIADLKRALESSDGNVRVRLFRDYKYYDVTVELE